jgi:DNA repair protein RadC
MRKMTHIPLDQRPREKLITVGPSALSPSELLAVVLGSGTNGVSALDLAAQILDLAGDLHHLPNLEWNQLTSLKGIKSAKAAEIMAVVELSRRMALLQSREINVIDQPLTLVDWLRKELGSIPQEYFMVVFLNTKNHVIGHKVLFKGGLDRSIVHPRDVYREALKVSAARIIAVHNHPSGDVTPSDNDHWVTEVLSQAGETMGIPLLDHLIVSSSGYTSLKQILKKD